MLLLTLLAVGTLLAACGGDDANNAADPVATSAPAAGLSVDLDGVRVVAAWARPALATDPASGTSATGMHTHTHTDMSHSADTTTSAVYLTLENQTATALRIVSASSAAANAVELHESTLTGDAGLMQMAPVEQIEVPANGSLSLAPGGLHIMLIGLTRDLVVGDTIDLTLTTDTGETLVLEGIPIREPGT